MTKNLANRARAAAQTTTRTANISEDLIQKMEQQFQLAMPKGREATQLVRDAITALRMTRKLDQCDAASVLGGLMTCAQLGLRVGVLGQAWLLPFWNSRESRMSAQLVIGYQGLVELAHRSGQIQSLIARTVHSNDTFDVDYGLEDKLVHKPAMFMDRGEPIAYYAIVKYKDGGHAFIIMTQPEMEQYRDRFAMAKNREGHVVGPWRDNFEGMAHKTCVRQLSKWMPKSPELAAAITADETVRVDYSPTASPETSSTHIEGEIVPEPEPESVPAVEVVDESTGEIIEPEPEPTPEPEPEPGPDAVSEAQLRKIGALMNEVSMTTDRQKRLDWVSDTVGRQVGSRKELTKSEAHQIIEVLEFEASQLADMRQEAQQ